jgi:hypothetical protein
MKHEFKYTYDEKKNEIVLHSEIFGLKTIYELDENNQPFLSSALGADSNLCAIYALDEFELQEFQANKSACDQFLSELQLSFESNFEALLAARVKILENENSAREYFLSIIRENDAIFLASYEVLSRQTDIKYKYGTLKNDQWGWIKFADEAFEKPEADEVPAEISEEPKLEFRGLFTKLATEKPAPPVEKPKRAYRKRDAKTIEREKLLSNSRKAAVLKLREIMQKVKSGDASPEVTVIFNQEIFHISDSSDIIAVRDEKIAQLEMALKKFKMLA